MEGFALELEDELMNFSDVSYKSFVKSESEIITLFYDKFADIPLLSRMDAVAETFIDEIETLLNRDLPEEERIPLIEKFRKMYETMDFYVLYNRFLKKEGYHPLPQRLLEDVREREIQLRGRGYKHTQPQLLREDADGERLLRIGLKQQHGRSHAIFLL